MTLEESRDGLSAIMNHLYDTIVKKFDMIDKLDIL